MNKCNESVTQPPAALAEAISLIRKLESRLTATAQAFYVSGKRSDLQAAMDGWKADAHEARALIKGFRS
jgi:hypothetical protein